MKKLKNIVTGLLCMMLLVLSVGSVSAVTPYAASYPCQQCGSGSVYTSISRTYQHDEKFPCRHGSSGKDTYAVYEVVEREDCDSCSYRVTKTYEDHILKSCPVG